MIYFIIYCITVVIAWITHVIYERYDKWSAFNLHMTYDTEDTIKILVSIIVPVFNIITTVLLIYEYIDNSYDIDKVLDKFVKFILMLPISDSKSNVKGKR